MLVACFVGRIYHSAITQTARMKRRIVILEDDPAISDILSILLRRNGYEVAEFILGEPVIHGLATLPDLFVLDKQLADVDGVEICRHLKTELSTRKIPVIILSATPGLHEQAFDAGADAFIEKPFTSRLLLGKIAELLSLADAERRVGVS